MKSWLSSEIVWPHL